MAAAKGHDQRRGGVREVRAGVDLNAVTGYAPAPAAGWRDGCVWLAGGPWLFSHPQPRLRRLLDLHAFGWPPLTETEDGLSIAATCTLAQLARWRAARASRAPAAELARQCCDALLGSFKVQNVATVGGNICLSLPAGPMTSLTAALDGVAAIARPDGDVRRLRGAGLGDGGRAPPAAPPRRRAAPPDRVPPGPAVGRRPVGRPRHRPPISRRPRLPRR